MSMALDPVLTIAIRLAIATIFGLAVVHKIKDLHEFTGTLYAYLRGIALNGTGAVSILAMAAISAELAVVAASVVPISAHYAGVGAIALFLIYGGAIGLNLARGNVLLDCGCSWGAERQAATSALVLRNAILAIVCGLLLLPPSERSMNLFDVLSGLVGAAILLCVYLAANQLIANADRLKEHAR